MSQPSLAAVGGNERLLRIVRETVARGEEVWVAVTGDSMAPTFHGGDRILLGPSEKRPPLTSVVLFEHRGLPILHRVVRVNPESVVTRGDACHLEDPWEIREAPIARAIAVHAATGVAVLEWTHRFGWSALARYIVHLLRVVPRLLWRRRGSAFRRSAP